MYKKVAAALSICVLSLLPVNGTRNVTVVQGRSVGYGEVSLNWSGYEVFSKDNRNNYFQSAEGSWTVNSPDVNWDGEKSVATISAWVGLGGASAKSPVLWQAGTMQRIWIWSKDGAVAKRDYSFWYEDYGCHNPSPCPNNGMPVFVDYPEVSYGDRVLVKVQTNGTVDFHNLTTKESASYTVPIDNNRVGLSAEWITELSCTEVLEQNCVPTEFDNPSFSDAYAYGTKMSTYFDIFNYRRMDLLDNYLNTIAQPNSPLRHGFDVSCC